ncbi:MAG TPA: polysaccharide pyruvyl transferase family protein [Allosphingosinicella sp.]|jgi:hypothetical protein
MPPTIGVLTFHRCINYGSYWQARSLVTGLRDRGHEAVLLDHDCPRVKWSEYRCAFQPLLPQRTARSDFHAYARKARKVLDAADRLPLSRRFDLDAPQGAGGHDIVMVGSDEVWNLRHPWYGGRSIFYGDGLEAERLVSYAASFGNHDAAWGLDGWWADKLRAFDAIAVRDDNSKALVRNALGAEPEIVLDPCLQFPPEAATGETPAQDAYIAVYGHNFPDWFAQRVREWADRTGRRLVSIGYRNDWADEQHIDAGPEDFARMIGRSSGVATNFFHGCVFSLVADRPFVCATSDYRSNKVRDLLRTVGAEPHLTSEADGADRFDALLGAPLDRAIHERIEALRGRSTRYLDHVLA